MLQEEMSQTVFVQSNMIIPNSNSVLNTNSTVLNGISSHELDRAEERTSQRSDVDIAAYSLNSNLGTEITNVQQVLSFTKGLDDMLPPPSLVTSGLSLDTNWKWHSLSELDSESKHLSESLFMSDPYLAPSANSDEVPVHALQFILPGTVTGDYITIPKSSHYQKPHTSVEDVSVLQSLSTSITLSQSTLNGRPQSQFIDNILSQNDFDTSSSLLSSSSPDSSLLATILSKSLSPAISSAMSSGSFYLTSLSTGFSYHPSPTTTNASWYSDSEKHRFSWSDEKFQLFTSFLSHHVSPSQHSHDSADDLTIDPTPSTKGDHVSSDGSLFSINLSEFHQAQTLYFSNKDGLFILPASVITSSTSVPSDQPLSEENPFDFDLATSFSSLEISEGTLVDTSVTLPLFAYSKSEIVMDSVENAKHLNTVADDESEETVKPDILSSNAASLGYSIQSFDMHKHKLTQKLSLEKLTLSHISLTSGEKQSNSGWSNGKTLSGKTSSPVPFYDNSIIHSVSASDTVYQSSWSLSPTNVSTGTDMFQEHASFLSKDIQKKIKISKTQPYQFEFSDMSLDSNLLSARGRTNQVLLRTVEKVFSSSGISPLTNLTYSLLTYMSTKGLTSEHLFEPGLISDDPSVDLFSVSKPTLSITDTSFQTQSFLTTSAVKHVDILYTSIMASVSTFTPPMTLLSMTSFPVSAHVCCHKMLNSYKITSTLSTASTGRGLALNTDVLNSEKSETLTQQPEKKMKTFWDLHFNVPSKEEKKEKQNQTDDLDTSGQRKEVDIRESTKPGFQLWGKMAAAKHLLLLSSMNNLKHKSSEPALETTHTTSVLETLDGTKLLTAELWTLHGHNRLREMSIMTLLNLKHLSDSVSVPSSAEQPVYEAAFTPVSLAGLATSGKQEQEAFSASFDITGKTNTIKHVSDICKIGITPLLEPSFGEQALATAELCSSLLSVNSLNKISMATVVSMATVAKCSCVNLDRPVPSTNFPAYSGITFVSSFQRTIEYKI